LKRAVISDIHANLPAFEAVLADVEEQGCEDIYCLGDVIGYGPDPRRCIQLAQQCAVNLLGNHEEAVLFGAIGFNPKAKVAIDWTREQLSRSDRPQEENRELWNFIGSLEKQRKESSFLYVHGSPRDPTREYIFKQDVRDRKKMDAIFASPPDFEWKVCFAGHTHHPGIFAQAQPYVFLEPAQIDFKYEYRRSPVRVLVNVGSVGQPRDGDWRASYVVLDEETIHFRRLDYDVGRTLQRFKDSPNLPDYLAKRLQEGK
jgi:diadenosine tetraphosphatase ApaH/serine/threonine PP2A family protein phosphatase